MLRLWELALTPLRYFHSFSPSIDHYCHKNECLKYHNVPDRKVFDQDPAGAIFFY